MELPSLGARGPLTSWEGQHPRQLYADQLEATKSRARAAQREVARLRSIGVPLPLGTVKNAKAPSAVRETPAWTDREGDVCQLTASGGVLWWECPTRGRRRKVDRLTITRSAGPKDQFTLDGPLMSTIVVPPPGPRQIELVRSAIFLAYSVAVPVQENAQARLDGVDAEMRKLEFLTAQMSVYTEVIRILVAQVAKLELDDIAAELSQDRIVMRERFYVEATRLLRTIEESFDAALLVPLSAFSWICADFRSLIAQYPFESSGAAAAGVVMGAAAGGASALAQSGGPSVLGALLHAGNSGIVASAALGGIVGFFVVSMVVGLASLAHFALGRDEADGAEALNAGRRKLERMIEAMRERDLPLESLTELRSLFDACFLRTVLQPDPGDTCIVCHEPLPVLDSRELVATVAAVATSGRDSKLEATEDRPVRAPLCDAKHFLHRHCHMRWMQSSQDFRCTVCRR